MNLFKFYSNYFYPIFLSLLFVSLIYLLGYPFKDFLLNYTEDIFIATKTSGFTVRFFLIFLLIKLIKKENLCMSIGLNNLRKIKNIQALFIPFIVFSLYIFSNPWKSYNAEIEHFFLFFNSVLIVAIFEELLFRGFMFNFFYKQFKSNIKSALVSSFIFGFVHYLDLFSQPENIIGITKQVLIAISLGMFFCGLYLRTGNILASILIHFLFKVAFGANELFINYQDLTNKLSSSQINMSSLILTTIVLLIFFLSGLFMIKISNTHRN